MLALFASVASSKELVHSPSSGALVLPKLRPGQRTTSFGGVNHNGSLVRLVKSASVLCIDMCMI